MNKENTLYDNEASTQLNDTNSYSTRRKNMRSHKLHDSKPQSDIIPYRYEKAAVVIQRHWRFRMAMQRRVYAKALQEVERQNEVVRFENEAIGRLAQVYEEECNQLFEIYNEMAEKEAEGESQDCQQALKKLAALTFKLTNRQVDQTKLHKLQQQLQYSSSCMHRLREERDRLRSRVSAQFQEEEQAYLRRIKEANMELLRVSKLKNECEKRAKEAKIEHCRREMGL